MKAGVFFLLLGILALSGSVITNPIDYFNFIEGIALSVCGASLLVMRRSEKNKTKPSDSNILSSIGMTSAGRTTENIEVTEQIIREAIARNRSNIVPKIVVAKHIDYNKAKPAFTYREELTKSVDSLIDKASSFITD